MIAGEFVSELSENLIVAIDDFLPASVTCRMVEAADRGDWRPSTVTSPRGAKDAARAGASGRKSSTLMAEELGAWMSDRLREVEGSLERLLGVEPPNLEPWQMTRYRQGEAFDYHLDCGAWRHHPSGERKRTVLLYLQAPVRGGATHFRAQNLTIRPMAGRLAVWQNLLPNGNCNHAMIHCGRPVWQGRKIVLSTWEREARYQEDRPSFGSAAK
jgi:predicted 2-oxoglutarate/Fe(II)-dependent dioxygenase YbiX